MDRMIGRDREDVEDEGDADRRDAQDQPEAKSVEPDSDSNRETIGLRALLGCHRADLQKSFIECCPGFCDEFNKESESGILLTIFIMGNLRPLFRLFLAFPINR